MPGTQDSGRPGGNPDLKDHQFEQKYNWDEPCTAKMTLRLPPLLYAEIKKLPNWQEEVRKAIAKIVEISGQETPRENRQNP